MDGSLEPTLTASGNAKIFWLADVTALEPALADCRGVILTASTSESSSMSMGMCCEADDVPGLALGVTKGEGEGKREIYSQNTKSSIAEV